MLWVIATGAWYEITYASISTYIATENEIDNILEEYIYIVALILSVKAPLHENSGIVTQGYNTK